MPGRGSAKPTGRRVVERFAAHLAHLLNASDELNAGTLYSRLVKTLSGESRSSTLSNPFVDQLVALQLYAPGTTPEEGANAFIKLVLNRPLFLAGSRHHHKGHELLLALCRRGVDERWQTAELIRSKEPPDIQPRDLPRDFASVHGRIIEHCNYRGGRISRGNPAASMRDEFGPLYLKIATSSTEVPEELSLEGAIRCAPTKLRVLVGAEFDAFCSLMIKAVETANAHYGALVTLGLSPPDWATEITVNTAKRLSAFMTEARREAEKSGCSPDAVDIWEAVWGRRPVPGFSSSTALYNSDVGGQLRRRWGHQRPAPDPEQLVEVDEADDGHEGSVNVGALRDATMRALRAGRIDQYGAWFLLGLSNRKTLRQLSFSVRTLVKFGRPAIPESYLAKLQETIEQYLSDGDHPDIEGIEEDDA